MRKTGKFASTMIEGLERRRLFAVSMTLEPTGVLNVVGDDGPNTVTITADARETRVSVLGVSKVKVFKGTPQIEVSMKGGDDIVTARHVGRAALDAAAKHVLTRIFGGDGNDRISATTDGGILIVVGDGGADIVDFDNGNSPIPNGHMMLGGPGNDKLTNYGKVYLQSQGGDGDDEIFGEDGNDEIYGGPGNDILRGGAGNDTLSGEDGNDSLFGGVGNDVLCITNGVDEIFGEDGDDFVYQIPVTVSNWSLIDGGNGFDTFYYHPDTDPSTLGHTFSSIEISLPNPY
ncbi:MAG: calcium-binding protein [Patescibacteria group bacterium]